MNQIILTEDDFSQNKRALVSTPDARFIHLQSVLKVKKSDLIKVCFLNMGIFKARIQEINSQYCSLELLGPQESSRSWCHLIIGQSRPPTMKKVLEHASSMGVKEFSIVPTELSEKSYSQSTLWKNGEYKRYFNLGLSQSSTFYQEPQLHLFNNFRELKSGLVFSNQENQEKNQNKFILTPFTSNNFTDYTIDFGKEVILAVGPERGWIPREENEFLQSQFQPVKISQAILRVEMAVFYALGQLELLKLSKKSASS